MNYTVNLLKLNTTHHNNLLCIIVSIMLMNIVPYLHSTNGKIISILACVRTI